MELRFDFADDDSTTGFRLKYFELYNWGTYDKQIVKLSLDKHNGLLTGDIGSGKSTIVDALTTLLVPHQKIVFNKAAGAEFKERTLSSYILGEYKSAQDETFKNSKAIALRDESRFSVLLARFENSGFDESFTIAQFFHISNKQVHKFFITSKGYLEIKKDFIDSNFKDIRSLKKYLKSTPHTEVYDSFKDYSKDFKRAMGLRNDQALNLFYQTVSLKAIGNLTSFVREHMLEVGEINTKIDELCKNFSELNHAHTLVLRAKEQIEILTPVDKESKEYEKYIKQKSSYEKMRNSLSNYFASFKKELLDAKIEELELEMQKTNSLKTKADAELESLTSTQVDLKVELQKNGGDRIKTLKGDIEVTNKELDLKKEKNKDYNSLAKDLKLGVVSNEHRFLKNNQDAQEQYENIDSQSAKFQNEITRNNVSLDKYKEKSSDIDAEILHLQNNRSNIPNNVSKIREAIAKSLNINEDELPFVGELLEVNDADWQGAIERILHNFSISLLVSEKYYEEVSQYVNSTNLRGKLVYLKVVEQKNKTNFFDTAKNSLINKIDIKADSTFFEALKSMMEDRFDIPCVESLSDFRKFKKALTINGQFKSNYSRHEKDDRFELNDKRRWSLGWDNLQKLTALQEDKKLLKEKKSYLIEQIEISQISFNFITTLRDKLRDILKYKDFDEIDWYSRAKKIENFTQELDELQKSSDILKSLQTRLESVKNDIANLKPKSDEYSRKLGALDNSINDKKEELSILIKELQNSIDADIKTTLDELFDKNIQEKLNLVNISLKERELRNNLQKNLDKLAKKITQSSEKLIAFMNVYTNAFKVESKEFDASVASINDFKEKLNELKRDDLPKFEKRFKELFKEKTIQKTAMIQAELEHQAKEIKSKIHKINNSLKSIEYNSGTFITLIAEPSINKEIRDFKQDLKSAISYAISDDNSYDEAKFTQIKQIISRFNGRENFSDVDKKWRSLVTDVRNWFNFSASEKYVSDSSEKEYYAHSGGKSGGQKEKLAYTVLASSLAFQFGLEYNEVRSRSFRFVMIDEAFGRGSDESTKYALKLFEKLNLQLLVITPKQKINVIEPFVKSVHFVHNQDGMNSSLLSMNIQEYQKNKKNKNESN